jgi:hypothetical protein
MSVNEFANSIKRCQQGGSERSFPVGHAAITRAWGPELLIT